MADEGMTILPILMSLATVPAPPQTRKVSAPRPMSSSKNPAEPAAPTKPWMMAMGWLLMVVL